MTATAERGAPAPMNVFERYLTLWVFLCIVAGIVLGQLLPGVSQALGSSWPSTMPVTIHRNTHSVR